MLVTWDSWFSSSEAKAFSLTPWNDKKRSNINTIVHFVKASKYLRPSGENIFSICLPKALTSTLLNGFSLPLYCIEAKVKKVKSKSYTKKKKYSWWNFGIESCLHPSPSSCSSSLWLFSWRHPVFKHQVCVITFTKIGLLFSNSFYSRGKVELSGLKFIYE